MSNTTKPRAVHPVDTILPEIIAEISYLVYLSQLQPSMTPEESAERSYTFRDIRGQEMTQDDASRRRASSNMNPATRTYLRVLVDMGLVKL